MSIGPRKMLSLVYGFCLKRIAPEKIEQWIFELEAPLPGGKVRTDTSPDEDAALFLAAAAKQQ